MSVDKEKLRSFLDGLSEQEKKSLRAMINARMNTGPRKPGGGRKKKVETTNETK